jgi:hypothetical protein
VFECEEESPGIDARLEELEAEPRVGMTRYQVTPDEVTPVEGNHNTPNQ